MTGSAHRWRTACDAAYATCLFVIGVAVSFAVAVAAGCHEAWDSDSYYVVTMSTILPLAAVAGAVRPHAPWLWAVALSASQPAQPVLANLWRGLLDPQAPLFLIVGPACFGAFLAPTIALAYGGALGRSLVARLRVLGQ